MNRDFGPFRANIVISWPKVILGPRSIFPCLQFSSVRCVLLLSIWSASWMEHLISLPVGWRKSILKRRFLRILAFASFYSPIISGILPSVAFVQFPCGKCVFQLLFFAKIEFLYDHRAVAFF